jgi:hypothetical protein
MSGVMISFGSPDDSIHAQAAWLCWYDVSLTPKRGDPILVIFSYNFLHRLVERLLFHKFLLLKAVG